jgi:hypothetical protein
MQNYLSAFSIASEEKFACGNDNVETNKRQHFVLCKCESHECEIPSRCKRSDGAERSQTGFANGNASSIRTARVACLRHEPTTEKHTLTGTMIVPVLISSMVNRILHSTIVNRDQGFNNLFLARSSTSKSKNKKWNQIQCIKSDIRHPMTRARCIVHRRSRSGDGFFSVR